jgi:hypothetical protein
MAANRAGIAGIVKLEHKRLGMRGLRLSNWAGDLSDLEGDTTSWSQIGSGTPSPKVVPPQEPIVFHNDFSRRNVLLNANVINRTKVPPHVSKEVRDFLKLSAGEQSAMVLSVECPSSTANWWRR